MADEFAQEELERFQGLFAAIDAAHDAEHKAHAINRLEEDFASFVTIPDPDLATHSLKGLLKSPNHLVFSATLNLVPSYASYLSSSSTSAQESAHAIKVAVTSLLPACIERTGDSKERIREAAARAVEELGKAAIIANFTGAAPISVRGKEQETPLQLFERLVKETGLMAKSAKTKEQICIVLQNIKASSARFPIKSFLPTLVGILSDADPYCREASKAALISLFSSASGAAKADLKKELEGRGVKKSLMDTILQEVFNASHDSTPSEVPLQPTREAPASSTSQPPRPGTSMATTVAADDTNISPVYVGSKGDLDRTFATMLPFFEGKETEHNWQSRESSVIKVRGMLKAGVHEQFPQAFINDVWQVTEGILKAVASLRTTLSMQGIALISDLATRLGDDLDPCVDAFVTNLLKMAGFTKKLVANGTQETVKRIFQNVSYRHKFLDLVTSYFGDKNVAIRIAMAEHLTTLLEAHAEHRKQAFESHDGLGHTEKALKKGLGDQNKDVRSRTRDAFYCYKRIWPTRATTLEATFDAATRKQLAAGPSAGPSAPVTKNAPPVSRSAVTAKRPCGPSASSAILAAKKAAAERMARERREAQAAEIVSIEDSNGEMTDEAATSPASLSRTASGNRQRPVSMAAPVQPFSVPLPSSPMGEGLQSPGLSPSYTRSPFETRQPAFASPSNLSTPASKSLGRTSSGSSSMLTPTAQLPTRMRKSSASSSSSSTGSSRSIKARSMINSSSSTSPSAALSQLRLSRQQPQVSYDEGDDTMDDTIQLGSGGAAARDGDDDATVDLMGMGVNSPFKSTNGHSMMDDSTLMLPHGSLSGDATPVRAADTTPNGGDESSTSTPRMLSTNMRSTSTPGSGGKSRLPRPVSMISPRTNVIASLQANTFPRTPRARNGEAASPGTQLQTEIGATAAAPTVPADGWFMSRAQRLDAAPISPLKSKPDALLWVEEIAKGTADSKVFRHLAKLSAQFKVEALPTKAVAEALSGEHGLKAGSATPSDALGLTGLRRHMQQEDEATSGEVDDELLAQQTEAWRDGQLFEKLWAALETFIMRGGSDSNGQVSSATTPTPTPQRGGSSASSSVDSAMKSRSSTTLDMSSLSLLYKLICHQYPLFLSTPHLEHDVLSLIFRVRASRDWSGITSTCDALIDCWAQRTIPALGLANLHPLLSSLAPTSTSAPTSTVTPEESTLPKDKATRDVLTLLGLRALGSLFTRLAPLDPSILLDEELPRFGSTIGRAFNDDDSVALRQASVSVLAQVKRAACKGKAMEEGTVVEKIFDVVAPLRQAQRDLLLYYFSRE